MKKMKNKQEYVDELDSNPLTKYVKDKEPSIAEMQEFVGGYIERIYAPNGDDIIVDEDGKRKNKEVNLEATIYWLGKNPLLWKDTIVGNAMILSGKAKLT